MTGVEYALIVGLVSLVVAGGAAVVGPALAGTYSSAGNAAGGSGVTTEGDDLCAGLFVTDPVTCDPETGTPDTSACPGLAQGDGSAGDPWACVVEPTPTPTPTETPSATPTPTETPSATPTPTPTAYAGATPRSNYANKFSNRESYALPVIAGIQYAAAGCDNSKNDGCRNYTVSGGTVTADRDWKDRDRKARLTIRWTIPATDTTQQATGTFTVEMTS